MKFTLPELPYAHNALEPIISEKPLASIMENITKPTLTT